jgi:hypothetical protein
MLIMLHFPRSGNPRVIDGCGAEGFRYRLDAVDAVGLRQHTVGMVLVAARANFGSCRHIAAGVIW